METIKMYTHPEAAADEIWVGNTSELTSFPPDHLKSLSTIRLGKQAYDIHGKTIPTDYCLPVIIGRSDADAYNTIMTKRSIEARYGTRCAKGRLTPMEQFLKNQP